jgi:hypothetical protein
MSVAPPPNFKSLFEQCLSFTDDEYWKNIYRTASNGKFPISFGVKEGYLLFRHKKNPQKVLLPTEDPQLFYDVTNAFFRKAGGLMSEKEKTAQWAKTDESAVPTKWTQIKNNAMKRGLQELYIASAVKKYNLSELEQLQLQHMITLGMVLQVFSDIRLNTYGRIEEFVGLQFDPEKRLFYFQKPKTKQRKVDPNALTDTTMGGHAFISTNFYINQWTKFIKSISKVDKSLQKNIYEQLSSSIPSTPLVRT